MMGPRPDRLEWPGSADRTSSTSRLHTGNPYPRLSNLCALRGTNLTARISVAFASILLLCMPLLGGLAHAPNDDAGTGADAPDDPRQAFNFTPGSYVGNLTPGSYQDDHDEYESYEDADVTRDADWYRAESNVDTPLACTDVTFTPDEKPHNETRVHLNQPDLYRAWINTTTSPPGTTLAMVGPGASDATMGLTALDPPRVTSYAFEFDTLTLDEAAGASQENAVPGSCFGDTIDVQEEHDWTFDAEEGDFLFLSFGTGLDRPDELRLTAPNGTTVGSITSGDDIALGAATLDEAGTWTLTAEGGSTDLLTISTTSSDYLVGFTLLDGPDDDDDKSPCRPHCMVIG